MAEHDRNEPDEDVVESLPPVMHLEASIERMSHAGSTTDSGSAAASPVMIRRTGSTQSEVAKEAPEDPGRGIDLRHAWRLGHSDALVRIRTRNSPCC